MNQLLREFPPGYGGIERVAHNISTELGGDIYSFRSRGKFCDPLPVNYSRHCIGSFALGRLLIPFPSRSMFKLLLNKDALIAHLPCPTVLFLLLLSRLMNRKRRITIYWHAFIEPRKGFVGILEDIYQKLALKLLKKFPVICTSPIILRSLVEEGFKDQRLLCIPCSISKSIEDSCSLIWEKRKTRNQNAGSIIAIGRLDSYKRIDLLIRSFAEVNSANRLLIIGDGPDRKRLQRLANYLKKEGKAISFYGCVDESLKLQLLSQSDLLILPADRSNEAFGIAQLEAMACGIPSFAFKKDRSGMYWVSNVPESRWSGNPADLSMTIEKVLENEHLYKFLSEQSRKRYEEEFSSCIWSKRISLLKANYA